MPSEQTRNVSLTAELNRFILAQVASGHYQNASEVVRASLRLLMQQVEHEQPHAPAQPNEMATPRAATRGRHARRS
jgi:antitoxin ParD1/3/4